MRVITFKRYGAPEVLQYQEVGEQVPSDNEVLIRGKRSAPFLRCSCVVPALFLNDYGMYGDIVAVVE